jgi:ABC-type bacteriocin/lantibiotic exporter with double-glycine peptidase domain
MTKKSSYGYREIFVHFPVFIRYVFVNFPVAKIAVCVTLIAVAVEYLALSVMIPLSIGSAKNESGISLRISELWSYLVVWLGWTNDAHTWLWVFLFILCLRILLGFIQTASNTLVSKKIMSSLSSGIFGRVITDEPLSEIYRRSVGYYSSLGGDEAVRTGQIFFNFMNLIGSVAAALVGMTILFLVSSKAFYFTVLFLIISALLIVFSMRKIFPLSTRSILLSREASTVFIEAFNGVRSIRSMGGQKFVTNKYHELISNYSKSLFYLDLYNNSVRLIPGLVLVILGLILLFPSVSLFGEISVLYLFSIFAILIRVLSFLGTAVSSGGKMLIDIRGALDLKDVIHNQGSASRNQEQARHRISCIQSIEICNLSYEYESYKPILIGINGKFNRGNVYALIGQSGTGKSTLADMLLGLMEPISGHIQIGSLAYKDINLESIRQKVVLVEQQTRIFSASIKENIAFGLSPTEKELDLAIESSGLGGYVNSSSSGLDSWLDYQGSNLSGGQRQRIGIARALIRNPDVLILDEATSALDLQTRNIVLENLIKSFRNRILIFITHDKYIADMADEVWHIENGKLKINRNHRYD